MGDEQTHLSYCLNARLQTRQLPVGDALWLARHKQQEQEYVLDFLVERKRVDDLWSSIKDTRYKQQKLRIMRCGVRKILYLVEGDPNLMDSAENLKTAYAFEHPHICSFEHSHDT
jgi:crossover junction endonuclease MUS81